jgi:hypothetical protein
VSCTVCVEGSGYPEGTKEIMLSVCVCRGTRINRGYEKMSCFVVCVVGHGYTEGT